MASVRLPFVWAWSDASLGHPGLPLGARPAPARLLPAFAALCASSPCSTRTLPKAVCESVRLLMARAGRGGRKTRVRPDRVGFGGTVDHGGFAIAHCVPPRHGLGRLHPDLPRARIRRIHRASSSYSSTPSQQGHRSSTDCASHRSDGRGPRGLRQRPAVVKLRPRLDLRRPRGW